MKPRSGRLSFPELEALHAHHVHTFKCKLFGYLISENEPRRRPIPAPTEAPMAAPILNLVRHSPIFLARKDFIFCN